MELQQLRYFLALADELNFTRAAATCWVSQQAFSKSIAQLERRLGAVLVVRRARGCSLTPAGHRLAAAARGILGRADELAALVSQPAPSDDETLRVGLLLDGLGPRTTTVLAGYRAALPSVALQVQRIQPHELISALLGAQVDVALVHGPIDDPGIEVTPLFTEPRSIVVSLADDLADAEVLQTSDVLSIAARERRDGIDPAWEGFFTLAAERNGHGPERRGAPAGSLEELLWGISLDNLFLTVPEHLAATYPGEAFGVRYVPVPDLPEVIFSVCHRRGDVRPAVQRFVAVVQAAVS